MLEPVTRPLTTEAWNAASSAATFVHKNLDQIFHKKSSQPPHLPIQLTVSVLPGADVPSLQTGTTPIWPKLILGPF